MTTSRSVNQHNDIQQCNTVPLYIQLLKVFMKVFSEPHFLYYKFTCTEITLTTLQNFQCIRMGEVDYGKIVGMC
jgi:hypothetical protein